MKILIIAPEPYYEERGTPIAVDLLIRALCDRGDSVDALTTHLGLDRNYPKLRLIRVSPPFAPKRIPPGPSLAKLYCDFFIFIKALMVIRRGRYDIVHAIEEASFMAWIARILGGPRYVIDIDSSMTTQIVARFKWLRWAEGALRWLEEMPLKRAAAAVPVCEALAGPARKHCPGETVIIPDVSLANFESGKADNIRQLIASRGPVVLYVGNLEPYQGIGLLLDAFASLKADGSPAQLVIIGGAEKHIEEYKAYWKRVSSNSAVHFLGPRPVGALDAYLRQADVLVSPRVEGVNTPMKVYSYLDSGTPVVATDLPTHTQVMNSTIARLASPTAAGISSALREVLENPEAAAQMANAAREYIAREHGLAIFNSRVDGLYDRLDAQIMSTTA